MGDRLHNELEISVQNGRFHRRLAQKIIMEKETILIVDDNADLMQLLIMLLSPKYHVIKAHDGYEGLRQAKTHRPDLILLDMNMPRMSGIEMLEVLRKTNYNAPIIFMTAAGSEYVAVQVFKLGVHDYLSKPFNGNILEKTIDRALKETRLMREKEQLAKQLAATETVHQTVAALAHHVNNQLMVIHGGLDLLQETAVWTLKKNGRTSPDKIITDSQTSVFRINAVLRVLQRITNVELTTYYENEQMLDIEAALEEELRM